MNFALLNKFSLAHVAVVAAALMVSGAVSASSEHTVQDKQHVEHDAHSDKPENEHADEHADEHGDEHGNEEYEEGQVHISAEQILASGITTQLAQAGDIKQMLMLYGRAVLPESATSQVKARFAGLITAMNVEVGERVTAGQVIAEVESNSSLKRYLITAPISGVVESRSANVGELATDNVLLSIIDDSQLWAQYQVFAGQLSQVRAGQALTIAAEQNQVASTIQYLLSAPTAQTYKLARAPLDNTKGLWAVGKLLSGNVTLSTEAVALVINNRAVQIMEGEQVIFIRNQEGFEKRVIELGQSDSQMSQVFSGLDVGEEYAINNSFVLKGDLEKSSAGHGH
jgi:cobalt-zinc-cadmium efflux system membrane fusion protein